MAEPHPDHPPESPDLHLEPLIALILTRYGDRIPEEAHGRLHETLKSLREAVAALYAYPLTNADEPDTTFAAWQGED